MYQNENTDKSSESTEMGMSVKLLSWVVYALKWLGWFVRYGVVWPAAVLMLLIIALFRTEGTTPGDVMAKEIARATLGVGYGEYRISACLDDEGSDSASPYYRERQTDGALPAAPVPPALCRETGRVVTDAKGYAASINDSLRVGFSVWAIIAVAFALVALGLGQHPYYHPDGRTRSAVFRYGTPAVPEDGLKKETSRE